mmetsp:Transcript_18979/g.24478  ORF Transcript_18979/g.24478 Transcript_18979/m.24478 type:complete len:115 (+) Transcript_18979:136-480(+)
MGSCRMGANPKEGAIKESGETWEVKDLYIADASTFPTSLGINPMITVQAVALKIAKGIAESLIGSNTDVLFSKTKKTDTKDSEELPHTGFDRDGWGEKNHLNGHYGVDLDSLKW